MCLSQKVSTDKAIVRTLSLPMRTSKIYTVYLNRQKRE